MGLSQTTQQHNNNNNNHGIYSNQQLSSNSNNGTSDSLDSSSVICAICQSKLREPKLLDCLHVFCKSCLTGVAQVFASKSPVSMMDAGLGGGNGGANDCQASLLITCPKCKQDTLVSS